MTAIYSEANPYAPRLFCFDIGCFSLLVSRTYITQFLLPELLGFSISDQEAQVFKAKIYAGMNIFFSSYSQVNPFLGSFLRVFLRHFYKA